MSVSEDDLVNGDGPYTAHEFSCGSDRWWYTFDSSTGERIYADCEAVSAWIQKIHPEG